MIRLSWKVFLIGSLMWVAGLSLATGPVFAQSPGLDASICAKLAQGKAYKEASSCFVRIANSMNKPVLSPVERKLKGLYLTNAAKLMKRTADQQTKPHLKVYFYEQSALMYRQYLTEKLCTQKYRCQEIQGKLYTLEKDINYGQLTVVASPGTKGKLSLQGYKFEKEATFPPNLTYKLRPGKYRLIIEYSDQKNQIKQVVLAPGQNQILTLEMPKPAVAAVRVPPRPPVVKPAKASAPIWAWVVLGIGGAALVSAPILFGLGSVDAASASEKQKTFLEGSNQALLGPIKDSGKEDVATKHKEIYQAHEAASTKFLVGWILGGVGVAAVTVGIIGIATAKPKAPPPTDARLGQPVRGERMVFERFSF